MRELPRVRKFLAKRTVRRIVTAWVPIPGWGDFLCNTCVAGIGRNAQRQHGGVLRRRDYGCNMDVRLNDQCLNSQRKKTEQNA